MEVTKAVEGVGDKLRVWLPLPEWLDQRCSTCRNLVKLSNTRVRHKKTKFSALKLFLFMIIIITVCVCVACVGCMCGEGRGGTFYRDSVEIRGPEDQRIFFFPPESVPSFDCGIQGLNSG